MKWANNTKDGIVLDFFAGSGTTGHAVMEANAEDGGNRRFILVQLHESPDPRSEVASAGFETIAAYSRERLRRSANQIARSLELGSPRVDLGFRAMRVDTTNMTEVLVTPDAAEQSQLLGTVDTVKADRSGEDLLFQVMLDWGLELGTEIERSAVDGHDVIGVDGDALIACFEDQVGDPVVRSIALRRPLRAVFKDSAFASDAARINAEQIFREISPETEVKAI